MADIEQVGTKIQVEFVDYSEYTPGNIDPTKALENLESGETLAKSLGKAKRWIEVLQEGGGGGSGGAGYLHRIILYRKGYYYLCFDLYTSSSSSFQGDTQAVFNSLGAAFTSQGFTGYSWKSIPQVTGWYRETSDGTTIPIGAIYFDGTHFIGIREGVSLTTFANATISLTNMEEFSTSPKGSIFDNNIQAVGGGSGSSVTIEEGTFTPGSNITNTSTASKIFREGKHAYFALLLNVTGNISANSTIGTIDSGMRPSQLLTVPGLLTWESNADAAACGINISNNGNVVYYGPSIGNGRHIVINCSYLLP